MGKVTSLQPDVTGVACLPVASRPVLRVDRDVCRSASDALG